MLFYLNNHSNVTIKKLSVVYKCLSRTQKCLLNNKLSAALGNMYALEIEVFREICVPQPRGLQMFSETITKGV